LELKSNEDAVQWVDRLAMAGVDWIKLGFQSASFDMARTPISKPSIKLFRTIVERAHDHNLPVAVHHYWLKDLRELVELPFDTLEHITEDGEIDDLTLTRMAERGLPVTTDLEQSAFSHEPHKYLHIIDQGAAHLLPKPQRHIARLLRDVAAGRDIYGLKPPRKLMEFEFIKDLIFQKMQNLKKLSDNNILVGAATDAGVHMFMGILPDELCRMSKAGLNNTQVLRTATIHAARLLHIDDVGQIKKGFRGDMVLYKNDPLEDIEALKKPEFVMRDGVPIIWQDCISKDMIYQS
jgi:imidazolonepropionase-like amidohydrolase